MGDSNLRKGKSLRATAGAAAILVTLVLLVLGCLVIAPVMVVFQDFFVADPEPPEPVLQMSIRDWNKAVTPGMGGEPYKFKNQSLEVQGKLRSKSMENFVIGDDEFQGLFVNCVFAPSIANREKLKAISPGQRITVRGVVRVDGDLTLITSKIVAVDPDKAPN